MTHVFTAAIVILISFYITSTAFTGGVTTGSVSLKDDVKKRSFTVIKRNVDDEPALPPLLQDRNSLTSLRSVRGTEGKIRVRRQRKKNNRNNNNRNRKRKGKKNKRRRNRNNNRNQNINQNNNRNKNNKNTPTSKPRPSSPGGEQGTIPQQKTPESNGPLDYNLTIPEILEELGLKGKLNESDIDFTDPEMDPRLFLEGPERAHQNFQRCVTSHNKKGTCRYLRQCLLPEFIKNFATVFQYKCRIGTYSLGVCCPHSFTGSKGTTTTITTTTTPTTNLAQFTTKPLKRKGCGRNTKLITRIVGGHPADPKEWPWMAALLRNGDNNFCGGTLITDRHILTAAHCVQGRNPEDVTVRLGEYDFEVKGESADRDFKVKKIIIHKDYSRKSLENDIAVIALQQSTEFNEYIWPVCLPPEGELFVGENAIVTGWGEISYRGPSSDKLMEVLLPVWKNEECNAALPRQIKNTHLCAGIKTGGKDACRGDSGGPLLHFNGKAARWTVIGVVSWGIRCAEANYPGVYTRVNMYIDWIKDAVFSS